MKHQQEIKIEKRPVEKADRRLFLKKVWGILGLVAFAELVWFTVSMFKNGSKADKNSKGQNIKVIGNVDDFPLNSVTPDRVNKFFLIRGQDGGFMAVSIICSHLGCSVTWEAEKNQFICPCHSSAFDQHGDVLNSPAPRPLDYYPVLIEAGKVKIDLAQKTKRNRFDKKQLTYAI